MMDRTGERLVSRYLDGVETPEELAQLEELALKDADIRRELIRLATLDTMARALVKETLVAREFAAHKGRVPSMAPSLWQSWWLRGVAAAAALVLCVGGFNMWQAKQAETAVVARVAEVRGTCSVVRAEGSRGQDPGVLSPTGIRNGETLTPGTHVTLGPDGYVKLAYADGTLVEVAQNTDLTLGAGQGTRLFGLVRELRGKRIQLDTGKLTARVAKQKNGQAMELATPHATATVLGTMLLLTVTPQSSELSVQTGTVAFATATQREIVVSGESARIQDGILRKVTEPEPPVPAENEYEDGAILFQDSFEKGFANWTLYTKQGAGEMIETTELQCPDIATIKADRKGAASHMAVLTGREPGGRRVGILTKSLNAKVSGYSLAYEYTYDGRPRRAMEGIEIDMNPRSQPSDLGKTRTQMARPAGEWNQVRWEYVTKADAQGGSFVDSRLFFNGEFIGRRSELMSQAPVGTRDPGVVLEVIEGQFRFANVTIRELKARKR
jgi:hypothetical protein